MTPKTVTIADLDRWLFFGAKWRVVELSGEQAVVDLCACTGEPVERRGSDVPALIRYLRSAQSDPELEPGTRRHRCHPKP